MKLIRDLSAHPDDAKGAVIALGNFDGVHLGHQAILRETLGIAKTEGRKAAVMTFEPHPREFFGKGALRLYPFRRKAELLQEMGIDLLFAPRFNRRFSQIPAQAFTQDILHGALAAHHVITGHNFFFGHKRQGNCDTLAVDAHRLGFAFTALPPVQDENGAVISSSAIRGFLEKGDIEGAAKCLGRSYEIRGRVRRGESRGRQIGFPTANLQLGKLFKPRFGVYAARMQIGEKWHDAVANLGIRPTFGDNQPLLEVHAFDVDRSFYGECVHVQLLHFIREEQRFSGIEELKTQIKADCKKAKTILKSQPIL